MALSFENLDKYMKKGKKAKEPTRISEDEDMGRGQPSKPSVRKSGGRKGGGQSAKAGKNPGGSSVAGTKEQVSFAKPIQSKAGAYGNLEGKRLRKGGVPSASDKIFDKLSRMRDMGH